MLGYSVYPTMKIIKYLSVSFMNFVLGIIILKFLLFVIGFMEMTRRTSSL